MTDVSQYNEALRLMMNLVYPVGSIYMSVQDIDPGILFGGDWLRIENRFLIGASSTYSVGSTSGNKNSATIAHNHGAYTVRTNVTYSSKGNTLLLCHSTNPNATAAQSPNLIANEGISGANANMPPYVAVYMWRRVR